MAIAPPGSSLDEDSLESDRRAPDQAASTRSRKGGPPAHTAGPDGSVVRALLGDEFDSRGDAPADLPPSPEQPGVQAVQAAPGLVSRGLRVAVIEDNRDSATSLTLLLELIGHEVQSAHAGPAGVELVRTWRPDAVISDLGLPGIDGFEVARRIRQEPGLEKVLLLALTGYGEEAFRRKSREAGFDYHLVKPADPLVLQRLLAEHAAQLDAREDEGLG